MADAKLSTSAKAALAKNAKMYKETEVVIKEGDTSNELYMMIKGKVGVYKGEELIAEIDEPMSYFGEMAAILGEPRTASIIAIEESEFMIVPGDQLSTLIDVSPAVGKKIIATLAQRLRDMNRERHLLAGEVMKARKRAQEQVTTASSDYKRLLYATALIHEQYKLPQVAELLKFGKAASMLASHSARMDLDDRHFVSSEMILKLHRAKK